MNHKCLKNRINCNNQETEPNNISNFNNNENNNFNAFLSNFIKNHASKYLIIKSKKI